MSAFKYSLFGTMLAVTTVLQPGPADAQDLQVTRHIGESITRRLTQASLAEAEGRKPEDPTTAWVTPSYTAIDFNDFDVDIDIYQFVTGIDKRFGSFYAGASAGYARTDTGDEAGAFQFDSGTDSPSISPYAAWVINDNVFVTGIAGYARAETDETFTFFDEVFDREFATDTAFTDLSVTGVLPLSQWVLTGRAGYRFAYTELDDDSFDADFFDTDSFVHTGYVTGEVGYRIERFLPYFRTIYENLTPEEGRTRDLVFVGVGATYDFSDAFSAGLSYQTELNQLDASNSHQAVLDVRFRL